MNNTELISEVKGWRGSGGTNYNAMLERVIAALEAPATVDCRGCQHLKEKVVSSRIDDFYADFKTITRCGGQEACTDFDKFQALPPVVLTKVTK